MTNPSNNASPRLSTLDVIGIGLHIEMFDQTQIWQSLKVGQTKSIFPANQKAYANEKLERKQVVDIRSANVLATATKRFVEQWQIPTVGIWPERGETDLANDAEYATASYFSNRFDALKGIANLTAHQFASLGAFCRNEPEEVLERAFQFFEGYPEVPALLLFAADGDMTRFFTGDTSRELHWEDGPRRFGCMSETSVAILLGRRERINALRPFVRQRETSTHAAGPIPAGYKPSKFLPEPWTAEQVEQFDAIPTIAQLHRPVRIGYRKDKDGKPTFSAGQQVSEMFAQERHTTFKAGFDAAIKEIENGKPARIFFDTGGPANGSHLIPLANAVDGSLPEFDLFRPAHGYDLHARIGNTGATSPLVQWALAALATVEGKDASMAVNLRQGDEATITVVTPAKAIQSNASPRRPAAAPASIVVEATVALHRAAALGHRLASGAECPQSGMWKCDHRNAEAGTTHFIPAGRTLPRIVVVRDLTAWEKMRGDSPRENASTVWTLLSYDTPAA